MKYNSSKNVLLVSIVSILPQDGCAVATTVEGDRLEVKLPFANRRRFVREGANNVFTDVKDDPAFIERGTKIACQIGGAKDGRAVAVAWANYGSWCNPTCALRQAPQAPKPQAVPVKVEVSPASAPAKSSEKAGFRPTRFKQRGRGPWKAKHREVPLPKPSGASEKARSPKEKLEPVIVPHVMEELPPPPAREVHEVLVTDGHLFLRVFERTQRGGKGRRLAEGRLSKLASRSLEFSGDNFLIEVRPSDLALSAFFPCNNVFTDMSAGMDRAESLEEVQPRGVALA
jgi:hypothetical protein